KAAELAKEMERLNAEKRDFDNNPNNTERDKEVFQEGQKKTIDRIAREQDEQAHKMENLIKEMKDAQKEYEQNGNNANAEKHRNASERAGTKEDEPKAEPKKTLPKEQPPITGQMRDVSRDLKDKNEVQQKTVQQQKNVEKQLDQVLQRLEGKDDAGLKDQI